MDSVSSLYPGYWKMECVTPIGKYFNFISLVGIVKYWDFVSDKYFNFLKEKFVPSTFLWFQQMFSFVYNAHLHFKKMPNITTKTSG